MSRLEFTLPTKTYEDSAGYDVYAAETLTILPRSCECISIEMQMAIPEGFFGKLFSRSGLLKDHFITCEAGVIYSDYRGIVSVVLINHSNNLYTVKTGNKIAQMVFMKKYNVDFINVPDLEQLGKTKRGSSGFGSSSAAKRVKFEDEEEQKNGVDFEKKEEDENEIIEEKAEIFENDKKVVDETVIKHT